MDNRRRKFKINKNILKEIMKNALPEKKKPKSSKNGKKPKRKKVELENEIEDISNKRITNMLKRVKSILKYSKIVRKVNKKIKLTSPEFSFFEDIIILFQIDSLTMKNFHRKFVKFHQQCKEIEEVLEKGLNVFD